MTVPDWLRPALVLGVDRPRPLPSHDDLVLTFASEKKTGWPLPVRVLRDSSLAASGTYLLGVKRIDAKVYIAATESAKCATMAADQTSPPSERNPAMPAVEMNDRQVAALIAVKNEGPCTAKVVAEAIQPGSDSRGAAQTLRRMVTSTGYIERTDEGLYKITAKGRSAANRILKAQEGDDSTSTETATSEPDAD